jgi:transketolase C-terminal domain/subunit
VVEDHVSHGGLTSLVYETVIQHNKKIKVFSLNLDEKFSESGSPEDLEKHYGFDSKSIAKLINAKINLAK